MNKVKQSSSLTQPSHHQNSMPNLNIPGKVNKDMEIVENDSKAGMFTMNKKVSKRSSVNLVIVSLEQNLEEAQGSQITLN